MRDASTVSIVRQPKAPAIEPGGRPETSLPEHVALGKFDGGVSLGVWAYNEELLIESFLTRSTSWIAPFDGKSSLWRRLDGSHP